MQGGGRGGGIIYKTDVEFQFGNFYDNGGMKHLINIHHKREYVGRLSVSLLVAKMTASLGKRL